MSISKELIPGGFYFAYGSNLRVEYADGQALYGSEVLPFVFVEGAIVTADRVAYTTINCSSRSYPRIYRIGPVNGPPLVSTNLGGLFNRMAPLLSVMHISKNFGRTAYVAWDPNPHCCVNFGELFDFGASEIEEVGLDTLWSEFTTYNDQVGRGDALELSQKPMFVHSFVLFNAAGAPPRTDTDLVEVFKALIPSSNIRSKVADFDVSRLKSAVGLHVRRPYLQWFTDMERKKFPLESDFYFDLISSIKEGFPHFESIFLCSNDMNLESELEIEYGDKILRFNKTTTDNSSDGMAVQEALTDFILLSMCPVIISQTTTAFGKFAYLLGETYDIYRIDPSESAVNILLFHETKDGQMEKNVSQGRKIDLSNSKYVKSFLT